jgi:hypothetical protein
LVGGTASIVDDYIGIALDGITKSVSFAAGSAIASVFVLPTADSEAEADENVSLTLVSGTDYRVGTATAVTGTIKNDDLSLVSLSVVPTIVTEDSLQTLSFKFRRTGPTMNPLTVEYAISGSASLGADYTGIPTSGSTKSVTFPIGSETAMVTVQPIADKVIEEDETISLTIVSGNTYIINADSASASAAITDDDKPAITLSVSSAEIIENSGLSLTYLFTRTVISNSQLTVKYSVSGTATPDNDFTGLATSKTITFEPNEATALLVINPTADATVEADETIGLTLVSDNSSLYTIQTQTTIISTIKNDDLPAVTLSITPATVSEDGAANLVYTFTRNIATS